jgi:hypothetical protein
LAQAPEKNWSQQMSANLPLLGLYSWCEQSLKQARIAGIETGSHQAIPIILDLKLNQSSGAGTDMHNR